MSKVAIAGNASGTGTFTIAAPNSNTDRTLTLPDEAGTVLTSASSLPAANLTGSLPAGMGGSLVKITDAESAGVSSALISSTHITSAYATYMIDYAICMTSGSTQQMYVQFSDDNNSSWFNLDSLYNYRQIAGGGGVAHGVNGTQGGVGGINNNSAIVGANVYNGDLIRGQLWMYLGRFSSGTGTRRNMFYANVRSMVQQSNTIISVEMVETFIRSASAIGLVTPNSVKFEATNANTFDISYTVYGVSGT